MRRITFITTIAACTLGICAAQAQNNVGIGVTDPSRSLEVGGAGTSKYIRVSSASGPTGIEFVSPGGGDDWRWRTEGGFFDLYHVIDDFALDNFDDIIATFSSTGRLGIGTISPQTALDIVGGIRATGDMEITNNVRIGITANDFARLEVSNTNTTYSGNVRGAFIQSTHDGSEDVYGVSVNTTSNGTGNVYGDRITSFGFDANATVYGTYTTAIGANGTMVGLYAGAAGGSNNIAARFGSGDVEVENRLRVNTTAQNAIAHIRSTNSTGSNATALRIESNNDGNEPTYGTLVTAHNTATGNSYGHYASVSAAGPTNKAYAIYGLANDPDDFAFYGVGNTYLSGDLRIGQNVDPYGGDYKVVVDGKILSEEVRVQNSLDWPDYVFEDSYTLMPLDELAQSIAKHGHLPNIPSAAVVERDGIALGEMQVRMMEKIEELTLYILQQREQIDDLKRQLTCSTAKK